MYFRPYPRINSREMTEDTPQVEMDISHRFSQQLGAWLKGLFGRPFESENRADKRRA